MHLRFKNYALVICLFVFLFVIIGSGLHLASGGAFLAAATGTPLVIYVFHRKVDKASREERVLSETARNEVTYISSKPDKFG